MTKTAYLHPLITKNFIFDFPSQFSTKQLSTFIQNSFEQTTSLANKNMQAIMNGTEVLWYIKSKTTNTIIGFVNFHFDNQEQSTATLDYQLNNNLTNIELAEVSNRIAHICFDNLKLEKIIVSSILNDFICQELKIHYNMGNDILILK